MGSPPFPSACSHTPSDGLGAPHQGAVHSPLGQREYPNCEPGRLQRGIDCWLPRKRGCRTGFGSKSGVIGAELPEEFDCVMAGVFLEGSGACGSCLRPGSRWGDCSGVGCPVGQIVE